MSEDDIPLKIRVATPYSGPPAMGYARSLGGMMASLAMMPLALDVADNEVPFSIKLDHEPGSILPQQRNSIVEKALKDRCTHLLWIDADQTFPMDTLHRLLAHDKDYVGCNIARKSVPSEPTAFSFVEGDPKMVGPVIYTRRYSTGLQRVAQVGTGLLLTKMHIYEKVIERFGHPIFALPWDKQKGRVVGEDNRLCNLLRHLGIEMWIDHDLSKEVGHVGEFEFKHEHIPGYYEPEHVADPVPVAAG